jgi:hypothetical protein
VRESLEAPRPEFRESRVKSRHSRSKYPSDDFGKGKVMTLSSMPRERNDINDEKGGKTDLPSIESTFEALKKVISIPTDMSSSRDPSLEVFDILRAHFEQIRKAIDHLDPQKTLEAATSSTGNAGSTSFQPSSLTEWIQSITSLTQSVPFVHQAIQLVSNQIRNIRDRLAGSTQQFRSFPSPDDMNLIVWTNSFESVAKQFDDIQLAWHDILSKGVPLISTLTQTQFPVPSYYFLDSPEEAGLDNTSGGDGSVSKQEDIILTPSRIKDLLSRIEEARQRLRQNVRDALKRMMNGHSTGKVSEEIKSNIVRDSVGRQEDAAVAETLNQFQVSVGRLADLYSNILNNFLGFLPRSSGLSKRQATTTTDRDISIVNPVTEIQTPSAPNPFGTENDGFPYNTVNVLKMLNRHFDAIVDLLTRLSRFGPIELTFPFG